MVHLALHAIAPGSVFRGETDQRGPLQRGHLFGVQAALASDLLGSGENPTLGIEITREAMQGVQDNDHPPQQEDVGMTENGACCPRRSRANSLEGSPDLPEGEAAAGVQ